VQAVHVIRALADRTAARELLIAAALPVDDLDDPAVLLHGALEAGVLLGVVGSQSCGAHALLRSLAVAPAARTRGLGRLLCDHVIAISPRPLWLLTTTARDYFARAGWVDVARDEVPAEIRATAQFSTLCPSTAHVMRWLSS